jgi:hypothetical protein
MVLAKCWEITPSTAAQVSAVKFPIAEARGFGLLTALLGSPIEDTQGRNVAGQNSRTIHSDAEEVGRD